MKINRKINCKNQKELQTQSIKTLLIKSIKTNKININRNIDKFIDQNQYPMLREHKFNYYQLFNIIVVSLYKMQFRPKITTKWGKKVSNKNGLSNPSKIQFGHQISRSEQIGNFRSQTSTKIILFSTNIHKHILVFLAKCEFPIPSL